MSAAMLDREGASVETWDGFRAASRARSTGVLVVLVDATGWVADVVGEGGRWMLVCDEHACSCHWPTQAAARSFMAAPEEWCPDCTATIGS